MQGKRILIVGGVAGGATAAAHARRLSESAAIILLERGPHVSFANCGLPYFVGGEIQSGEKLLVQTPQGLRERFNLDVRVSSEAVAVDPDKRCVEIRNLQTGETYVESYDDLVLATGAAPLKPPIPGIDREGLFTVRNVPNVLGIDAWIRKAKARNAVVVGGGFIGLEMVEQLHRRGLAVSLVEALPQVLPPFDEDMAAWAHRELRAHDVGLYLGDGVERFEPPREGEVAAASVVVLKSGRRLPADLVILGIGVRPETQLAKTAGIEIGERGGIRVNDHLQTSRPHIWAVGDVVEVRDRITGKFTIIPLAGPANRQGRIVAENIFGANLKYRGTLGTAILRLFGLVAACAGANERALRQSGLPHQVVHLHPGSHAEYYPGAHRLAMKILFDPESGGILGAQIVGEDGVDKRMDVIATAIHAGMTVHDLEDLELSYAPPFGSAKDPVNLAGMVAQHVVHGDIRNIQWHELNGLDTGVTLVLDVRDEDERSAGFIPGSINIPLAELRGRLAELPREKEIVAYCQTGQRSYYACKILQQHGFRVRNLSGSYRTWKTAMEK